MVQVAGDDRDDRRVTVRAGPGRRPPPTPPRAAGPAVQAAELIQAHVQLDLGGLPGPVRHAPGGDQPPARLLQRVVTALPHRPGVLGPGLLPQRVQHRAQRRGALRRQVPGQLPALTERHIQADRPVPEPVVPSVSGRAVRRRISSASAARSSRSAPPAAAASRSGRRRRGARRAAGRSTRRSSGPTTRIAPGG